MIELGDKLRFKPTAFSDSSAARGGELLVEVTGTVVYINEAHRYYRVRWEMPCSSGHECFKY